MDIILLDYKVAQVKVIFRTPPQLQALIFTEDKMPEYLAYVEWFSSFKESPEDNHLFYEIHKVTFKNKPVASIIPLYNIVRSVHLFPKFPTPLSEEWTSSNVLDNCDTFYVNSFSDRHASHTLV